MRVRTRKLKDGDSVSSGNWTVDGAARIFASGKAEVMARDSSVVWISGEAHVTLFDRARAMAADEPGIGATADSRVIALGRSRISAYDRSRVMGADRVEIMAANDVRATVSGDAHARSYNRSRLLVLEWAYAEFNDQSRIEIHRGAKITHFPGT